MMPSQLNKTERQHLLISKHSASIDASNCGRFARLPALGLKGIILKWALNSTSIKKKISVDILISLCVFGVCQSLIATRLTWSYLFLKSVVIVTILNRKVETEVSRF